jgi:hypothetical protein
MESPKTRQDAKINLTEDGTSQRAQSLMMKKKITSQSVPRIGKSSGRQKENSKPGIQYCERIRPPNN